MSMNFFRRAGLGLCLAITMGTRAAEAPAAFDRQPRQVQLSCKLLAVDVETFSELLATRLKPSPGLAGEWAPAKIADGPAPDYIRDPRWVADLAAGVENSEFENMWIAVPKRANHALSEAAAAELLKSMTERDAGGILSELRMIPFAGQTATLPFTMNFSYTTGWEAAAGEELPAAITETGEVGLKITACPRITPKRDGFIVDVAIKIGAIVGVFAAESPGPAGESVTLTIPTISTTEVKTTLILPNGHSGLIFPLRTFRRADFPAGQPIDDRNPGFVRKIHERLTRGGGDGAQTAEIALALLVNADIIPTDERGRMYVKPPPAPPVSTPGRAGAGTAARGNPRRSFRFGFDYHRAVDVTAGHNEERFLRELAARDDWADISFRAYGLSDRVLEAVAAVKTVENIHLVETSGRLSFQGMDGLDDRTHFTDEGLAKLAELPNLRDIHLNTDHAGDKTLTAFGKAPKLRSLRFCGSPKSDDAPFFGDAGLTALGGNPALRTVELEVFSARGRFGIEGVRRLAAGGGLTGLRVDLPADIPGRNVLAALASLENPQRLSFANTKFTDDDLAWMAEKWPGISELRFDSAEMGDEGVAALARLVELTEISLRGGRYGAAALADICAMPKLRTLWLAAPAGQPDQPGHAEAAAGISDAELAAALGNATVLGTLYLGLPGAGDATLAALAKLPELTILRLDGRLENVTSTGWKALAAAPKLGVLNIYGTPVDDETAVLIGRLPELCHLGIGNAAELGDDALVGLAAAANLANLTLRGARNISAAGLAHFDGHPRLVGLELSSFAGDGLDDADVQAFRRRNPKIQFTINRVVRHVPAPPAPPPPPPPAEPPEVF